MRIRDLGPGGLVGLWRATLLCAVVAMPLACAAADSFPSRNLRIVVSFPPGTTTDTLARTVAQRLGEALGQPVIVENRPGAAGKRGPCAGRESRARRLYADDRRGGDVRQSRDLRKEGRRSDSRFLARREARLVADRDRRASFGQGEHLQELIDLARTTPQKLAYSTPGAGTPTHVAAELLAQRASIELLHVPYPGSGQLLTDVISGEVPVAFTLLGAAQPFLRAGQLKAIATTGTERVTALPDTPTVAESGFPGYDVTTWCGILVPAGTSAEVIDRLHLELVRVIALPDVRERLIAIGMVPETSTPQQLGANIRAEVARWGPIIKAAGIAQE